MCKTSVVELAGIEMVMEVDCNRNKVKKDQSQ